MENPFDAGYFTSPELREMGFASVGENVQIAKTCNIIGLPNISIGDSTRIDGHTHIIATNRVVLGAHVHIGACCHMAGRGGIEMADFSGLSQGGRIYSVSDDFTGLAMTGPTVPAEFTAPTLARVVVGRHAVIGSGTVVLPGCHIGEGSTVGALSLVTRPLAPWGIYAGTPARRLRDRSRALLAKEAALPYATRLQVA